MKIKYSLILAAMLSTSVIAQDATPPAIPAPATPPAAAPPAAAPPDAVPPPSVTPPEAAAVPAPAKAKKAHKRKKKPTAPTAAAAPAAPLMTNAPAIVIVKQVNVRGQAHINSEIIGHLKKGDTVTVLELVTLKHPHTDEPANWARIAMPADAHAWVNTSYIDAGNQTVTARKLNIRSGPGENYSVIGRLKKGDIVKTSETKGDWTAIEPPTNSFAFVAAHLLAPQPETAPAAPPPPATTTSVVDNSTPLAPPPGAPGAAVAPAMPPVAPPVIPPPQPAVEKPLPKRIVDREEIVGGTVSIQAPSHYELHSLDNGNVMDYLHHFHDLALGRYRGMTVLVQGEEELDERWPNTPVLTIQRIQVVK